MFILLIVFTLVISGAATLLVKSQISKYSKVPAASGLTGAETAAHILRAKGIYDVQVVPVNGMTGDHYDPAKKIIALTPNVYNSSSTAAVGIAAHECGHAIQHQQAYAWLELRSSVVGMTQYSSTLFYLPFIFMAMGVLAPYTGYMIMALGAAIIMGLNLITLPVEFDASARAKAILPELGIIQTQAESTAVSRVLNAAALTYVAAFLASLANVVYYLALAGDRRR